MTSMPSPVRVLSALVPTKPLTRRLWTQQALTSLGEGVFNTGSAVFFTQLVGLSAARVGLGLTLAGVVTFLCAYPMGRLIDVIGPKRTWALAAFFSAASFGTWPFIHDYAGFLAVVTVTEVMESVVWMANQAYVIDVTPEEERIQTRSFLYSANNLGITIGALLSGIALGLDNLTALRWFPLLTLLLGLYNAACIQWKLPQAAHDLRAGRERRKEEVSAPSGAGPLRNIGWMATSFFGGALWANQTLLNVVIPLWLVERTDSPHWLLAWLFGTNTVLCIFLPTYTSQGVDTMDDALRRVRLSVAFCVAACLITMVTDHTTGLITVGLLWLGHVAVTGAELSYNAASWKFQFDLMDPHRRGEYSGVGGIFQAAGQRWSPAIFTLLAMSWHGPGWLVIAGVFVLSGFGAHPSVRAAQRFATRHFEPAQVS